MQVAEHNLWVTQNGSLKKSRARMPLFNLTFFQLVVLLPSFIIQPISYCKESARNEYKYPTILYSWLLYSTVRVLILLHL